MLQNKNISVIIPCYNEEKTIVGLINRIKKLGFIKDIIVVDDGSEDNTYLKVEGNFNEVIIARHSINLGKGAAVKTGCEIALKLGADILVLIDADGQHLPEEIPKLVEKLEKENLDIVFGVREMNEKVPLLRKIGNRLITALARVLTKVSLKDSQAGFKAFSADAYKKIIWQSQDYSVETEIIVNVGRFRLRYGEVPIETIYTDVYKGATIVDGFKIFINLLRKKIL
jgi:glycosyltransferase involved in cell wall biosynthesis